MTLRHQLTIAATAALALALGIPAGAHNGPPYPIVSNQVTGAYRVSIWTDPDATDDGSLGGQFWVIVEPASEGGSLPDDVRARVSIRALERSGSSLTAETTPEGSNRFRRFASLLMDHEGPFAVRVEIESEAGKAAVDSRVDATYDLRPSRLTLVFYALPFLLAGFLWAKLLLRRRTPRRPRPGG